jgi:hypothetical protein
VVIWNLIRRCNLTCKHCYALSADHDYAGELSTQEVLHGVMDDLKAFRRAGADPLGRRALDAARHLRHCRARQGMGFYIGLSTNGTLIDEPMADRMAMPVLTTWASAWTASSPRTTNSAARRRLRPQPGRRAHLGARGVKVGLRFTMTAMNAHDLPALLALMREEGATSSTSRTSTTPGAATSTAARTRSSPPRARRWTCCSNAPGSRAGRAGRRLRDRQQRRRRPLPAAVGAAALPQLGRPLRERLRLGRQLQRRQRGQHRQPGPPCTPTPCGGTTTWAACASGRSRPSGPTPPTR